MKMRSRLHGVITRGWGGGGSPNVEINYLLPIDSYYLCNKAIREQGASKVSKCQNY